MKGIINIYKTIVFCSYMVIALAMTGCIEELDGGYSEYTDTVCFTAKMENIDTKAVPVNKLEGTAGVIGYINSSENQSDFTLWENLNNVTYEFDGDNLKAKYSSVEWNKMPAGSTKLRLYSFTPKEIITGTSPTIEYTVPDNVASQVDIITAYAEVEAKDYNKVVPLTFAHALTGIKFKNGFDDAITVTSISVKGVCNKGIYTIGDNSWTVDETGKTETEFKISFGADGFKVQGGGMITSDDKGNVLMMIPQTFGAGSGATVTMSYKESVEPLVFSLEGLKWEKGDMITYTLNPKDDSEYIYFDLAAGDVKITSTTFEGYVYKSGETERIRVTSKKGDFQHLPENKYYVYQSTEANRATTGLINGEIVVPKYDRVTLEDGTLWSDFITNNTDVEAVIETWDDGEYVRSDKKKAGCEGHIGTAVVRDAGRTHTVNYIDISGASTTFNLTIDNIYSVKQLEVNSSESFRKRAVGGIAYKAKGGTRLTINFIGDNRMGCLHIDNMPSDYIDLEGTGSLTVADADFLTIGDTNYSHKSNFGASDGYISNFWNSAIGNNTNDNVGEKVYNLNINSGVIFAGTTAAEDCTAIGGGGNGFGQVTINGGVVTAVATTAGSAIGGGMGHTANGGAGDVTIKGGNIYAYNFANTWGIASSAIGGGGSLEKVGSRGDIKITGGSVYAYSALGTAIGGGSSSQNHGGDAKITITGGHIIAKSNNKISNGIGGGTGGTNKGANGGSATVIINGDPIIRTGSIGGGKTKNSTGNIGSAKIEVHGGDIQAQFVLAKGSGSTPTFEMYDGHIRNSNTDNIKDTEYFNVESNGGAVYLEEGSFTMEGGTISGCFGDYGGAVYIKGGSFEMTGGEITECTSKHDGGAVYLEGGSVDISGGKVTYNLAQDGNGGGFAIFGGNFNMTESNPEVPTEIQNNAAFGGSGGGIFVTSDKNVTVNLIKGSIESNSSDKFGGGICIDMEHSTGSQNGGQERRADVTVGTSKSGPSIRYNQASLQGGGLYARGVNAYITINGGKISDNTTSGYEANKNVTNDKGRVTLNGDDVTTNVVVTYNNNFAYYGDQAGVQKEEQRVVTATKSLLVTPTPIQPTYFYKLGYHIVGWNTRPDGKGTSYSDGQEVILTEPLTLYAQWKLD